MRLPLNLQIIRSGSSTIMTKAIQVNNLLSWSWLSLKRLILLHTLGRCDQGRTLKVYWFIHVIESFILRV